MMNVEVVDRSTKRSRGTSRLRNARLHLRCSESSRLLLQRAATYAGLSVSEFVLTHALAQAQSVVQAHETITLSAQDFERFLQALDETPPLSPVLERAVARHARLFG